MGEVGLDVVCLDDMEPAARTFGRRVDDYFAGGAARPFDLRSVVCLDDLERHARLVMDAQDFDYDAGGAETESTLRANASAFARVTSGRGASWTSPG